MIDSSLPANPLIEPVPEGTCRPLWSVMIPTYNCAHYLRRTLESVLLQDPGPEQMQIEVVDHCSTEDDPESVVKEVSRGRVAFYRKPKNEGFVANFNTCIQRSRGRLVHILHADDYVLPGFYGEIERMHGVRPDFALFATRCFYVDEEGHIRDVSQRVRELESGSCKAESLYYETIVQAPGVVIARKFYELNGGFIPEAAHVTDRELWVRAVTAGGGILSPEVLACYRVSSQNDTARLKKSGENVLEIMRLNHLFQKRHRDFSTDRAQRQAASIALAQAEKFEVMGDFESALANRKIWRSLARRRDRLKESLRPLFRLAWPRDSLTERAGLLRKKAPVSREESD
jgi:GT2 family glycosyltransferase